MTSEFDHLMAVLDAAIVAAHRKLGDVQAEVDRLHNARAALLDPILTERPPLVRPPAPSVPPPPVEMPKVTPKPERVAAQHAVGTTKYPPAEVAAVAREAIAAGRSAIEAVTARFGVKKSMGSFLVSSARKAGHDIPYVGGPKGKQVVEPKGTPKNQSINLGATVIDQPALVSPSAEAPIVASRPGDPGLRLRCEDCEETFPPGEVGPLFTHTTSEHNRRPYTLERIPRTEENAA